MGTVLRVLVVIILFLSISAFVLAWMLFGKRELLIGRTQMLEEQFIKVAKTIEAVEPGEKIQPTYTAKDVDTVTEKELDNPAKSTFWNDYQYKLEGEETPPATFDIGTQEKRLQLRQYYQQEKSAADGKLHDVINPLTGKKSHEGAGTMYEILDSVQKRASLQYTTLNNTRAELKKVREELVKTIDELNLVKAADRTDKKTIVEKQKQIDDLTEKVRGLEQKIEKLEEEKRALTAEVAEAKNEIARNKETIDELTKNYKSLEKKYNDLIHSNKGPIATLPTQDSFLGKISPGDKGRIVASDEKFKFVIVELSDAFMTEILGANRDGALPQIDMMVRRPGMKSASGEFVTRIRLRQVLRQQNLVVADILIDWQQVPVEKDDVVFF